MKTLRRIAIIGGSRIPFARQNSRYVTASNLDMLTATLNAVANKFSLQGMQLGEVAAGAVIKHSRDANLSREATLASVLAPQTPAYDVQQACATSLEAAILVGNKIATGQIEVGIAGGADSTSDVPIAVSETLRQWLLLFNRTTLLKARLQLLTRLRPAMLATSIPTINERRSGMSMGEHCEIMVKTWGISREDQDALAFASHRNAINAYEAGFYDDLVTPYLGMSRDDNVRADTSQEKLARLHPSFDKNSGKGTLTAGNSTPFTDGAAAILLASDTWAVAHELTPQAFIVDAQTAAVEYIGPDAEGLRMAPVYAVPRLLARNGLTLQDFDYYEIHEAFAGQVLCTLKAWEDEKYCREKLGLDHVLGSIDRNKLNVNGGSLALGHPFAATGARILAAAAKQLMLHRKQFGKPGRTLVSVCAAGGLGAVAILEG